MKVTKTQAEKIASKDGEYFVGTLNEVWAFAQSNGFTGNIICERLDGANYIDGDSPSFSKTKESEVLTNENGEYWYITPKIKAEYEMEIGSEFNCAGTMKAKFIEKNTGSIDYRKI